MAMKQTSTTKTLATSEDEAPPLSQANFDGASFRIGKQVVSRSKWQTAVDLYEQHAHDYVADRRRVRWNESAWLDRFTALIDTGRILERETRLELATSTLVRLRFRSPSHRDSAQKPMISGQVHPGGLAPRRPDAPGNRG
jgi:hypothetical protein